MYRHGWYQIAFEQELGHEISPLTFGTHQLMAIKQSGRIRIFDSTCPHRGANIAFGGVANGDEVACPFHGHRIHLGIDQRSPFCVREYPCVVCGGMVFFRLSEDERPDLAAALKELEQDHTFTPGFRMSGGTRIEVVIENGFDSEHFKTVHGLLEVPTFEVRQGAIGELIAEGEFAIPWGRLGPSSGSRKVARYEGRAYSPGVFVSRLRGEPPFNYTIITTAVPAINPDSCDIRLTLAVPNVSNLVSPTEGFIRAIIDASRDGLEKDNFIWSHLSLSSPVCWTERDAPARLFQEFCARFSA